MKNKSVFALSFVFGMFMSYGILAMAQAVIAASPAPSPVPIPTQMDVITQALELFKNWASLGIWAGMAAALTLLINALKAFGLFSKLIPEKLQAVVVALIGVLTVGLGSFAVSKSIPMALGAAFSSAGFAVLIHEIYQDFIQKAPVPVPAEKAADQTPPAA